MQLLLAAWEEPQTQQQPSGGCRCRRGPTVALLVHRISCQNHQLACRRRRPASAVPAMLRVGYEHQYEGGWLHTHPGETLVGRAVTAMYMPRRPGLRQLMVRDSAISYRK